MEIKKLRIVYESVYSWMEAEGGDNFSFKQYIILMDQTFEYIWHFRTISKEKERGDGRIDLIKYYILFNYTIQI